MWSEVKHGHMTERSHDQKERNICRVLSKSYFFVFPQVGRLFTIETLDSKYAEHRDDA